MAPHHGVDVDKSAWKAGFYAQRLDNPRSRGAVHLVDENHVPTLRRDAPILDPHTASSWIELHLQPETANTDEVRLAPGRDAEWRGGSAVGRRGGGLSYRRGASPACAVGRSVGVGDGGNRKRLAVQAGMVQGRRVGRRNAKPPRLKQAAR